MATEISRPRTLEADAAPRGAIARRVSAAMGLLVSAALILSACAPSSQTPDGESVTGDLTRFTQQDPDFAPCELPADVTGEVTAEGECAHIDVPLDYAEPDGDTAQIAVFRVPARGDDRIGSLVTNPGGPGYEGLTYAAQLSQGLDEEILDRFDIVGFDPRGVGSSVPALDCFTDAERDAGVVPASELNNPDAPLLVEACADSVGGTEALAHFGTRDVARDMDVIREVLGDDKLSYAGSSYGTRLGAVYAEMFPQNVRALVLDGAMDPQQNTLERRVEQWGGMQRAFDQIAELCVAQGDCVLGDDVEEATGEWHELVRPLIDAPIAVGERELTFTAANDGIVAGLYGEPLWPAVIAGIAELAEGRGDTLLALRDYYHLRSADGVYPNSVEANFAIDCLDEDRFSSEDRVQLTEQILAAAPFLDPGTTAQADRDWCEDWPVEPTLGFPYAQDIADLPATLTVSVTGDALTPHTGGISLAETLGGSLLTVEGEQHGTLLAGNDCVDAAIAAYLVRGEVPSPGVECTL